MRLITPVLALLSIQRSHDIIAQAASIAHRSASHAVSQPESHIETSTWYDWGMYGPYPRQSYQSFGAESPWPNVLQQSKRCQNKDDGYLFLGPRGKYVPRPGPVMIDNDGNLIWLDHRWEQAMDVKVQRYRDEDYITFWTGKSTGTGDFGLGSFIMVCPRAIPYSLMSMTDIVRLA